MGFNFTSINYTQIRGIQTKDLRLTFTHQNVAGPEYGDSDNEFDTIDFFMNLNVNASIFAFYFTYGITDIQEDPNVTVISITRSDHKSLDSAIKVVKTCHIDVASIDLNIIA